MTTLSQLPQFAAFVKAGAKHMQKGADLIALAERLGFAEYNLEKGYVYTRAECSTLSVRVDENANGETVYQAGLRTYTPQIDTVTPYYNNADSALFELNAILEESACIKMLNPTKTKTKRKVS